MVGTTAVFNELLQQPFYFDLRDQHARGATPYQTARIFTLHAGQIHALYKRGYIETGQQLANVPSLTSTQVAALDLRDELCDELAFNFTFGPERSAIG